MTRRPGAKVCYPIFDPEDADLSRMKWRLDRSGYARATHNTWVNGKKVPLTLRAHRLVMARQLGRPLTSADIVDHRNLNRLDNRRGNLRITDHEGNSQNRRTFGRVGARGVTIHKATGKFQAAVGHKGRTYYCGLFDSLDAAAAAAAAKRKSLGFMGEEESK